MVLRTLAFALLAVSLAAGENNQAAQQMLDQGRADEAVATLNTQLRRSPQDAEAYNLLCRVYLTVDQWDQAIDACEHAVKLSPENSNYHLWLGRSYGAKAEHAGPFSAGHLAGNVRNEFETAVRLSPDSIDARADLADFYLEAPWLFGGGKQKASGQAQALSRLQPAQGDLVRARIAEKNKDLPAAESEYRKAIADSGGSAGTWLALARFYKRNSRFPEMEQAIAHATAPEMKRPDLLTGAAQLYIQSGRNLDEAARLLERYLSSSHHTEDAPVFKAHYLLGTLLERQGSLRKAMDQYKAALGLASEFAPARSALERVGAQARNSF